MLKSQTCQIEAYHFKFPLYTVLHCKCELIHTKTHGFTRDPEEIWFLHCYLPQHKYTLIGICLPK